MLDDNIIVGRDVNLNKPSYDESREDFFKRPLIIAPKVDVLKRPSTALKDYKQDPLKLENLLPQKKPSLPLLNKVELKSNYREIIKSERPALSNRESVFERDDDSLVNQEVTNIPEVKAIQEPISLGDIQADKSFTVPDPEDIDEDIV